MTDWNPPDRGECQLCGRYNWADVGRYRCEGCGQCHTWADGAWYVELSEAQKELLRKHPQLVD